MYEAVVILATGWTREEFDDQPDGLKELIYTIIITDKQKLFGTLEGMIKLWSKKR